MAIMLAAAAVLAGCSGGGSDKSAKKSSSTTAVPVWIKTIAPSGNVRNVGPVDGSAVYVDDVGRRVYADNCDVGVKLTANEGAPYGPKRDAQGNLTKGYVPICKPPPAAPPTTESTTPPTTSPGPA